MAGRFWRSLRSSRGQALPVAIAAMAIGAVLVTPLLRGAGVSSRVTNAIGQRAQERYSMDAGIEWSGWRLMQNPTLTTDTSFSSAPISPLPAAINGAPFPTTEIRFVAGAGAVELQTPVWQPGGGDRCYAFSASDAGILTAQIDVDTGQVWAALLPAGASCSRPGGLEPLFGSAPYRADFDLPAASAYQLLIGVDTATSGTIAMTVPAATYEVRSMSGSRSAMARFVAGTEGVRVESWQLN
jgi:hypothetical protein